MKNLTVINEPRPFEIEELFFSRTDRRGLILGGNSVFCRISGYEGSELINAPHNIIRHPDVPKAVFKLLWDYLLADKPIVAYVKNKAKDGRYYWVTAYASPIADGFLSVRLKPSSAIFSLIPPLYDKMRKIESEKSVQASTDFLLQELLKLGFKSYTEFAQKVLYVEMEAREKQISDKKLARSGQSEVDEIISIGDFGRFTQKAKHLYNKAAEIESLVEAFAQEARVVVEKCSLLNFLAVNLAAQSERIGESGRTLNIVSSQFNTWGQNVKNVAVQFQKPAEQLLKSARELKFQLAAAAFQYEVLAQFIAEGSDGAGDRENKNLLAQKALELAKTSEIIFRDFDSIRTKVTSELRELSSSALALEIVRLAGKIESSQIGGEAKDISTQINEMNTFLQSLQGPFKKMNESIQSIASGTTAALEWLGSLIASTIEYSGKVARSG